MSKGALSETGTNGTYRTHRRHPNATHRSLQAPRKRTERIPVPTSQPCGIGGPHAAIGAISRCGKVRTVPVRAPTREPCGIVGAQTSNRRDRSGGCSHVGAVRHRRRGDEQSARSFGGLPRAEPCGQRVGRIGGVETSNRRDRSGGAPTWEPCGIVGAETSNRRDRSGGCSHVGAVRHRRRGDEQSARSFWGVLPRWSRAASSARRRAIGAIAWGASSWEPCGIGGVRRSDRPGGAPTWEPCGIGGMHWSDRPVRNLSGAWFHVGSAGAIACWRCSHVGAVRHRWHALERSPGAELVRCVVPRGSRAASSAWRRAIGAIAWGASTWEPCGIVGVETSNRRDRLGGFHVGAVRHRRRAPERSSWRCSHVGAVRHRWRAPERSSWRCSHVGAVRHRWHALERSPGAELVRCVVPRGERRSDRVLAVLPRGSRAASAACAGAIVLAVLPRGSRAASVACTGAIARCGTCPVRGSTWGAPERSRPGGAPTWEPCGIGGTHWSDRPVRNLSGAWFHVGSAGAIARDAEARHHRSPLRRGPHIGSSWRCFHVGAVRHRRRAPERTRE